MLSDLQKRLFTSIPQNSYLKNLKVMESLFKMNTFKSLKEVMESFFNIKNFKNRKKVMESFFGIKNFKSRKALMEFFLSFRNFKSRKKMTEFFFGGHALLSFHIWCKNFLEQYFLCPFPLNFFDYTFLSLTLHFFDYILISMKKDAEHISVNTVRATFLRHKWMVLHT